jgi:hypothetical protein
MNLKQSINLIQLYLPWLYAGPRTVIQGNVLSDTAKGRGNRAKRRADLACWRQVRTGEYTSDFDRMRRYAGPASPLNARVYITETSNHIQTR